MVLVQCYLLLDFHNQLQIKFRVPMRAAVQKLRRRELVLYPDYRLSRRC